ncbi:hypothetical protein [Yoonia sp.]|uniref:hypothetical protein n=1 Tax=Yoonia sp. TaxID=2212373 RepID=UPI0025D1795F|nr:hypothetical protein [Yoonia sp.]
MSHSLSLESFEEIVSDRSGPSADFNDGYAEGIAAGRAAAQADAVALTEAFVQSIADIDFTYAEARSQLLQSLGPLFQTLCKKILPHCVATGFAGQLADQLLHAAAADAAGPIKIHVHPDQRNAVEAATKTLPTQLRVLTDPALTLHAAWIQQGTNETLLDADSLLSHINAALAAISNTEHRTNAHG